jgi:hypothetical protein
MGHPPPGSVRTLDPTSGAWAEGRLTSGTWPEPCACRRLARDGDLPVRDLLGYEPYEKRFDAAAPADEWRSRPRSPLKDLREG